MEKVWFGKSSFRDRADIRGQGSVGERSPFTSVGNTMVKPTLFFVLCFQFLHIYSTNI